MSVSIRISDCWSRLQRSMQHTSNPIMMLRLSQHTSLLPLWLLSSYLNIILLSPTPAKCYSIWPFSPLCTMETHIACCCLIMPTIGLHYSSISLMYVCNAEQQKLEATSLHRRNITKRSNHRNTRTLLTVKMQYDEKLFFILTEMISNDLFFE